MEINKSDVNKVLRMDPDEFSRKLEMALRACGADKALASKLIKNPDKIKQTLGGLSQSDIDRIAGSLDKEKLQSILNIVRDENK